MQACRKHLYGSDSIRGKTVAVHGVGSVGYHLCKHLYDEGAKLIVTDIVQSKINRVIEEFGAIYVSPEDIYSVDCDIYAPCAMGATINDKTIPLLKAQIVCGGANNVLAHRTHGQALQDRNILYAPDYLANAGGVINVCFELSRDGYNKEAAFRDVDYIYYRMLDIL